MGGFFSMYLKPKRLCYVPNQLIDKETEQENNRLSTENVTKLNEFKQEIARKRDRRRQIIMEKTQELSDLQNKIKLLKQENERLKKHRSEEEPKLINGDYEIQRLNIENENLKKVIEERNEVIKKYEEYKDKNRYLITQISDMQMTVNNLNEEVLNFEKQRQEYLNNIMSLKEVIKVLKHMREIREAQIRELKVKVETIENTLADREINVLSQDLRHEYERQLQNIRNLKILYEERQRVDKKEKEELTSKLSEVYKQLDKEKKVSEELQERVTNLETENSSKYDEIKTLESNLGLSMADCREYQAELTVINQLFSEILLGFNNTQDINLDQLSVILEENRGLLQDIVVNEISKDVSYALPKLLLGLIHKINEENELSIDDNPQPVLNNSLNTINELNSVEEIVENLPKVWKVLIELLSHQKIPSNNISSDNNSEHLCSKSINTPKEPHAVLSVSQTFIRLKNLIVEKKALEKETNNLKQLNTHLESRLQDQEKRLETVTSELSKTWHVVGELQKQHQMLHTQEKILRYELSQKRKILRDLKEELENSREKWLEAKEKNTKAERQWKKLRAEFISRKCQPVDDINNSCESGYSDDREGSSDDEADFENNTSEFKIDYPGIKNDDISHGNSSNDVNNQRDENS